MKVKVNLLFFTIVLTIIVFGIATYLQRKLIHYEATVPCLVLTKDINASTRVTKESFRVANVPISLVATQRIVQSYEEIEGLYARDNIKMSQIAMKSQFDTKENLLIYEVEEGKEKIAIKIKSPENGMAFQVRENASINIYVTIRNGYENWILPQKERLTMGDEIEGYTVIKLLENVKVLGVFSSGGIKIQNTDNDLIDSVLIAVNPEEAKAINLIRDFATFNITGVNEETERKEERKFNHYENISGDQQ